MASAVSVGREGDNCVTSAGGGAAREWGGSCWCRGGLAGTAGKLPVSLLMPLST
jgi:hypothetical protein